METLTPIITIECSFSSAHQPDVGMRILRELLSAWKDTAENAHRGNKITITESGEEQI